MKIACLQLDIVWENPEANHAKVHALVSAAKLPAGSLLVLPEMFATGFSMNVAKVAEERGGTSASFLSALARAFSIWVVGGIVGRGVDCKGLNECLVFSPDGKEVTRYAKINTFTLAGETEHYASGSKLTQFDWQGFKTAPFICYDLRFPEIFRHAVMDGAQLFTVIANWPRPRDAHWIALLKARAIENQAYVAGVNRCGNDPKYEHVGRSQIIDPHGEVLADAGSSEGIISADADLNALNEYRRSFPALKDIRPQYLK